MALSSSDLKSDARAIFDAAVRSVQADRLLIGEAVAAAPLHPLEAYSQINVVGMGKAAMAMAAVVEHRWAASISGGAVVVPEGYPSTLPDRFTPPVRISVQTGGHPIPTARSQRGAERIRSIAAGMATDELLLVLISGGGSALVADPVEGVALEDARATFRALLESGAGIHAINAVRKHLTRLGGGQLARAAHPADVWALVISDVVGDDLTTIASGPTVPDPTTFTDAVDVLRQHDLWPDVPASVRRYMTAGQGGRSPDTLSAGDPVFDRVRTHLVGRNRTAVQAAKEAAMRRGYRTRIAATGGIGEARETGKQQAQHLLQHDPDAPMCLIWGGETTVTVRGTGTGGRNQEVALGAAQRLAEVDRPAVLLSGGTDGVDGPTDAAGAWATPQTVAAAQRQGFDLQAHLANNDAYPLLDALDQLLRTGPTHTNVMDVQIGLIGVPY